MTRDSYAAIHSRAEKARLMAILNVTPDSFYANSRFFNENEAISRGMQLIESGADILDIGGESTRPKAAPVGEAEELRRVLPVISALRKRSSIPISIDTYKPSVAQAAIDCGATIINDITGFSHPGMRAIAASNPHIQIVVMHMQGTPQTMQDNPSYPLGIMTHLDLFFKQRMEELQQSAIAKEQIILDPGIGFGKTLEDNIAIVKNLSLLKSIGYPLLFGASRKSFLKKILTNSPSDLLSTTLAVNTIAILAKVDIIRVHDVEEHRAVIDLLSYLY